MKRKIILMFLWVLILMSFTTINNKGEDNVNCDLKEEVECDFITEDALTVLIRYESNITYSQRLQFISENMDSGLNFCIEECSDIQETWYIDPEQYNINHYPEPLIVIRTSGVISFVEIGSRCNPMPVHVPVFQTTIPRY